MQHEAHAKAPECLSGAARQFVLGNRLAARAKGMLHGPADARAPSPVSISGSFAESCEDGCTAEALR
jgi:hypothetical protein